MSGHDPQTAVVHIETVWGACEGFIRDERHRIIFGMTTQQALAELDRHVQQRSSLRHPFYVAWQRGELTRAQLAAYARVYYSHVAAFSSYLEAAAAGTTDPRTRAALADNLADELGTPASHPQLWLDFAAACGVDPAHLATEPRHPAAATTLATFRRMTTGTTLQALAALYVYESQQPAVAAEKISGLRQHYAQAVMADGGADLASADALRYFEVHATLDVEHCAAERAGIARLLDAGGDVHEMLEAAASGLDAYWALLDGVTAEARVA